MTGKALKRELAALGATFSQGKGSHVKVTLNGFRSVIPMHAGRDLPIGTLNNIYKQLGLTK